MNHYIWSKRLWPIAVLFCFCESSKVILRSTSPAILDAKIEFQAELVEAEAESGPFVFRWSDNASPAHWVEFDKSLSKKANLTLNYSSKEYGPATYSMTVLVYAVRVFFRQKIASETIQFDITKELNGQLVVNQIRTNSTTRKEILVSTENETSIEVDLYDPSDYLAEAKISYFWFLNGSNFGLTTEPNFKYKFTQCGKTVVEASIIAVVDKESFTLPNMTGPRVLEDHDIMIPPGVKLGVFRTEVVSKQPLEKLTVKGNTWLKHGELLNVSIDCDGTGPWGYCWSIKDSDYNITGNESCISLEYINNQCSFPIFWYFRKAGNSDILVQITNGLTIKRKLIHVNIYDIHPQPSMGFVVVPVIAILCAFFAIAGGFYTFYKYQRDFRVEIADFDFNVNEEDFESKSFWERLRDSMVNTFQHQQNHSNTLSHTSSPVSSMRSLQNNPAAGIHYGSIT